MMNDRGPFSGTVTENSEIALTTACRLAFESPQRLRESVDQPQITI